MCATPGAIAATDHNNPQALRYPVLKMNTKIWREEDVSSVCRVIGRCLASSEIPSLRIRAIRTTDASGEDPNTNVK